MGGDSQRGERGGAAVRNSTNWGKLYRSYANRGVGVAATALVVKDRLRELFAPYRTKIRDRFRELDSRSYGYASLDDIFAVIDIPMSHSERLMVELFLDKDRDGRISYREFYFTFFADLSDDGLDALDPASTLSQVIVITRHGSRFPLKPMGALWPRDKAFWATYGGRLTPAGNAQLYELGKQFREFYIDGYALLDVHKPSAPSQITSYTSNSERTLGSAHSFLLGLVPELPIGFRIDGSGGGEEEHPPGAAVALTIADMRAEYQPLLHGFKLNPRYARLRARAFAASPEWERLAARPAVKALLEKLHRMSGFGKLAPGKRSDAERLQHMQSLAQQVAIERALQMPILSNAHGLALGADEERVLREIADHCCRLRYEGTSDAEQRELARLAAGLLPAELVRRFRARMDGSDPARLCHYSAHDNTLMALLAHLGLRGAPVPQFGAYAVFELHAAGPAEGSPFVRVAYNAEPSSVPVRQHAYLALPSGASIVPFERAHAPVCTLGEEEEQAKLAGAAASGALPPGSARPASPTPRTGRRTDLPLDAFCTLLLVERASFPDRAAWEAAGADDEAAPHGTERARGGCTLDSVRRLALRVAPAALAVAVSALMAMRGGRWRVAGPASG